MTGLATPGPFHAGELRAQALAGVAVPGAPIRDFMPQQHRDFFAMLRFLLLATTDAEGGPVATVLSGDEGFIASPDPRELRVHTAPDPFDPTRALLRPGSEVGLLGIDFESRRRNRANGVVSTVDDAGIRIAVRQSFGNCPKYIRVRTLQHAPSASAVRLAVAETAGSFSGIDAAAAEAVAAAETFFVATASGRAGPAGGVDISHRGGASGFVTVDGNTLTIPDYRGNRYFNTLGNLLLEPRAALLFVDFASGDLLHLQGTVAIDWDPLTAAKASGAERLWRFRVERGWRRPNALPLRWTTP